MRGALDKGIFRSLDHLIEVALENQLKAEGDGPGPWGTSRPETVRRVVPRPEPIMKERGAQRPTKAVVQVEGRLLEPPLAFDLDIQMAAGEIPIVADPDSSAVAGPLLWGQHYKFLPTKVALRVLARMASTIPLLGTFSQTASAVAVGWGERLRSIDKEQGRKLGDQVATSFPEGNEKSTHRFRDQYLAYLRPSDRRIDGMLPRLRFVTVYSDDGSNRIGLTSAGREFVAMRNPVIDDGATGPSLSDEEVSFLLRHIQSKLPAEAKHMAALLRLTSQGATSPEALNRKMGRFYQDYQDDGRPWTRGHLNTMRAGVTSRLFELGLLSKEKQGVAVTYHPTERGKNWLVHFDKLN